METQERLFIQNNIQANINTVGAFKVVRKYFNEVTGTYTCCSLYSVLTFVQNSSIVRSRVFS